jgi:uncharacterized protein (DUF433 family)/predicted nuclease of predicted toxin-antitoxin system
MAAALDRITVDPEMMNGQPCLRGMRLTVRRILEAVALYPDRLELRAEYPKLDDEDIRQALAYAANVWMTVWWSSHALDQGPARPRHPSLFPRAIGAGGMDALHVCDIGLSRASDQKILEFARADGRICIMLDADFHAFIAVANESGPSVIRVRQEGLRGKELTDLLL